MPEKNSMSRVVFLFHFQSVIANFFLKKMATMGLVKQYSEVVGPVLNLCQVRQFYDFTGMLDFPFQWFPWHFVAQYGYEVVGPGLSLCRASVFVISLLFVRKSIDSHGTVYQRLRF